MLFPKLVSGLTTYYRIGNAFVHTCLLLFFLAFCFGRVAELE